MWESHLSKLIILLLFGGELGTTVTGHLVVSAGHLSLLLAFALLPVAFLGVGDRSVLYRIWNQFLFGVE